MGRKVSFIYQNRYLTDKIVKSNIGTQTHKKELLKIKKQLGKKFDVPANQITAQKYLKRKSRR